MLKSKYLKHNIYNQYQEMEKQDVPRCDCKRSCPLTYFCIQRSCIQSRKLCVHCSEKGHQNHKILNIHHKDTFSVYNPNIQYCYKQLIKKQVETVLPKIQNVRQKILNQLNYHKRNELQKEQVKSKTTGDMIQDTQKVFEQIKEFFRMIRKTVSGQSQSLQKQTRLLVQERKTSTKTLSKIAIEIQIFQKYNLKNIWQTRYVCEAIETGLVRIHEDISTSIHQKNIYVKKQPISNFINCLKSLSPQSEDFQNSPYLLAAKQKYYLDDEDKLYNIIQQVLTQKNIDTKGLKNEFIEVITLRQTSMEIFREKMQNLIQKVILKQATIQIPEQIKLLEIKRQQIKKYQHQIDETLKKEKSIFNSINQTIELQNKRKQLKQKKIDLKQMFKIDFEPGKEQNQIIFSSKQLNIKELKQYFRKNYQGHQFVTVTMKNVKTLRGGAPQRNQFTIQINTSKLLDFINQLCQKLQQISTQNSPICQQGFIQNITQYKQEMKMYLKKLLQNTNCLPIRQQNFNNQIDVAIIMDTTGSMKHYLQRAKTESKNIIKKFKQKYNNSSINYAFVSYKDHSDRQKLCESYGFHTAQIIEKKIENIKAEGGRDGAEAVHDGLIAVKNLNWRQNSTKFVFLIHDAPPHGRQYCQDQSIDEQPNGCPCGITLNAIYQQYKKKNIFLIIKQCGEYIKTTDTAFVLKKIFKKNIFISSLEASDFAQIIAADMRNKVEQLDQTLDQVKNYIANINNAILLKVKESIKNIIGNSQQLRQLSPYWQQISLLREFLTNYDRINDLRQVNNTQNIEQIKQKVNQTLKSALQIKKIKQSKQKATQKMIQLVRDNKISELVKIYQKRIIGPMTRNKQQNEIILTLIENNQQLEGKEQQIENIIEKVFDKNYGQEIQQKKVDFEEDALRSSQRINLNQRIVEYFKNTYNIQRNLARKYTQKYLQR